MGEGGIKPDYRCYRRAQERPAARVGQEERLAPARAPPWLAQPTAGLAPDSDPLAGPSGAAAAGTLPLPIQGHRRQAHGFSEEDEQLLQEGLPQELHIGVTEGE